MPCFCFYSLADLANEEIETIVGIIVTVIEIFEIGANAGIGIDAIFETEIGIIVATDIRLFYKILVIFLFLLSVYLSLNFLFELSFIIRIFNPNLFTTSL